MLTINLDLRGEYIADCQSGLTRWNTILTDRDIGFQFALPHPGERKGAPAFWALFAR